MRSVGSLFERREDKRHAERDFILKREFRTFRQAFIEIPCLIVKGTRIVRWRILVWNPWLRVFSRLDTALG